MDGQKIRMIDDVDFAEFRMEPLAPWRRYSHFLNTIFSDLDEWRNSEDILQKVYCNRRTRRFDEPWFRCKKYEN